MQGQTNIYRHFGWRQK